MNISPISMFSKSPSFACQNCKKNMQEPVSNMQEDEVVMASYGPNGQYPVYRSQINMYEENYRRSREAIDAHHVSEEDSPKDFIERRKIGY